MIRSLVVCSALTVAAASEPLWLSARTGYEKFDGAYDLSVSGAADEHGHWNEDERFFVEAVYAPHAWLMGAGLVYQGSHDTRGTATREATRIFARTRFGATLPLGQWVALEASAYAAVGGAELTWDDTGIDGDDRAVWREWGGDADAVYRIPQLMEIGLGAGWRHGEASFNDVAGVDETLREMGFCGRIFIGAHF